MALKLLDSSRNVITGSYCQGFPCKQFQHLITPLLTQYTHLRSIWTEDVGTRGEDVPHAGHRCLGGSLWCMWWAAWAQKKSIEPGRCALSSRHFVTCLLEFRYKRAHILKLRGGNMFLATRNSF